MCKLLLIEKADLNAKCPLLLLKLIRKKKFLLKKKKTK